MPEFSYGEFTFEWCFELAPQLKRHYVTVERGCPVLLRGPEVEAAEQEALIQKRARWIREKLRQVNQPQDDEPIVTGRRLRYSGRSYYTEVRHTPALSKISLKFSGARFVVFNPAGPAITVEALAPVLEAFYRERAQAKLLPRVRQWERMTDLKATGASIRVFQSRWASCDADNYIEFHPRVMELPPAVQDYIIVHELCHTLEKNHTKAFWALVGQHMPGWKKQHEALERALFGDAF